MHPEPTVLRGSCLSINETRNNPNLISTQERQLISLGIPWVNYDFLTCSVSCYGLWIRESHRHTTIEQWKFLIFRRVVLIVNINLWRYIVGYYIELLVSGFQNGYSVIEWKKVDVVGWGNTNPVGTAGSFDAGIIFYWVVFSSSLGRVGIQGLTGNFCLMRTI